MLHPARRPPRPGRLRSPAGSWEAPRAPLPASPPTTRGSTRSRGLRGAAGEAGRTARSCDQTQIRERAWHVQPLDFRGPECECGRGERGLELGDSFLLALGGSLACLLSPVIKGLHGRSQRVVAHGPELRGRGRSADLLGSSQLLSTLLSPSSARRAREAEVAGRGALGRCAGYEGSSGRAPSFSVRQRSHCSVGTPGGARTALSRPQEEREGEERTESPSAAPKRGATQRCLVSSSPSLAAETPPPAL